MHEPRKIGTDLNIGVLFVQSDDMVYKTSNQTEITVLMRSCFGRCDCASTFQTMGTAERIQSATPPDLPVFVLK
ncbi:uncharacterized protein N7506_004415 [Penicillium brevicompactum]|uniref:uncharacterized protein n=1 Tax=Penicillium brevicompactum TaxID=5074 RepID=UPI00254142AC|nr:uncharacterized protein N7506_004415 [Penicillium brevicompactum]KAJ5336393.1 hypothetical protein N7506_004415 [Penicillium brevicompactum]